jgi:hypothetical protein
MKEKLKKIDSDQCWWYESGRRQTREHLFKECSAWKTQINNLWRQAGRKLGWRRPKMIKVSRLLREEKVIPDILQFLRDTGVGKVKRVAVAPGQ